MGCSLPVHTSQGMAAAGFDNGMAVLSRMEAGSQPNVQRDGTGEWCRRMLHEPGVDNHLKRQIGLQNIGLRIDDDGDLVRFEGNWKLVPFDEAG